MNPSVTFNPSGKTVTYTWYDSSNNKLSSKPTAAGTYSVTAYVPKSDNWSSAEASKSGIKIYPGQSSLTEAPTAKTGLVYNGSAQELVNAGTASNGTMHYKLEGGSYSASIPTGTDAGTYKVYYKVVGNSSYNDVEEQGPISVTISPKPVTVETAPKGQTLTYTGSAQALVTAGVASTGGTMQYKLGKSGTYSTDVPTATNVDGYTIYYKAAANNSNYVTSDEGNVSASIGQAAPTVTKAPAAITGLKYTGSAQALITAGTVTGGTIYYSIDNGTTWTTTIPTKTNADTYTIQWKVIGTQPNYTDLPGVNSISATISPISPTVTTEPKAITGLKYTGDAQALITAGSATNGTMQYKLSTEDDTKWRTTVPNGTDAKDYTVQWRVVGDEPNYSTITGTDITVSIGKIPSEVNTEPKAITGLVYNGNAQALVTAGTQTGGTIKYSVDNGTTWTETVSVGTNAGDYTVLWKVVGDANHLDTAQKSIPVSIAKHSNEVTVTANTLEYSGTAQALVTVSQLTGGTLLFSTDNKNWDTTVPTATEMGKYDVWYKVDGGTNYENIDSAKLTAEITKAHVVLTAPEAKDLTYNGEEQELITKGSVQGGTLEYMFEDGSWSTAIPTETTATTYNVYYRVVPDEYHFAVDKTLIENVRIKKHPVQYIVEPAVSDLTYNGNEQSLLSAGTADYGTVQYSTNGKTGWSTTIPKGMEAGSYTVYYRIKGLNTNYETTAATEATTIIKKASPDVTPPTAKTLEYNGNSQKLVNAGKTSGGRMKYSLDGTNWSTTVPSAVNAGTYTVYYKVEGGTNYNDFGPEEIDVTIAKIPAVVTVAPEAIPGLDWTGNEQYLVIAGEAEGGTLKYKLDDGDWQETPPTATEAGDYTILYKVFGDENHTSTQMEAIDVSVAAVSSEWNPAPAAVIGLVYTGDEQELITAGSAEGGTAYYKLDDGEWSTEIPAATDAGDYTVWYKFEGDANHLNIAPKKIETYIAKVPVNVITAPTAVTTPYNGEAQELMTAGVVEGGTIQYRLENGEWSSTLPKATNADSYKVWYKVDGDESHSSIEPVELTAKITKVDPTIVTAPAVKDLTYNDSEQELVTAGVVQGGTIKYSTNQNNWSADIPKETNAGDYPVWYMVEGDINHNDIEPVKLDGKIKKADSSVVTAPTAKTMTYNGEAQELVTAGSAANGTLKYKTEGKEWTTDIPTATEAGSYDIQYKVFGNDNYNDTEATTLTSVIDKANPVITVKPEANTLDYTGNAQQLVTAGTTTGGTIMYSLDGTNWDKEIPTGINADSYTVYYKAEGNNNYNSIDGGKVTAVINPVSAYITPSPAVISGLEWTGEEMEVITSGQAVGGTVTYILLDADDNTVYEGSDIPTASDIGEYTAWYKIKADDNHKNVSKTFIGEVTIDMPSATITRAPIANNGLIYNEEEQELIQPGTAKGGTLKYRISGLTNWSEEIPTAADVDVYTVYYKVFGDSNHRNSQEYSLNVAIGYTSFSVTFDSNGGSPVDSQTVAEYSSVNEPENPTWFNHTFLGWYNGSVKYDFNSQVTSNLTLTAKWEITNELLSSNTVSFKDNLNFNFMGKIADDAVEGAYVKVSYLHYGTPTEIIIPVNPDDMYAGKYYRFRCELTASEMTMEVKAELYINGMSEPISTRTRSIRDYCESGLKNKNVPAIEKTLLRATLNYGGYTQARFGYNPAPYANEGYEDSMDNVQVISEVNFVKPTEVKEGIGYVGSTVFFRTAPFIRYYFKVAKGNDVSDYVFSVNGKTLETVYDNTVGEYEYYYIQSSPELAYQLDKVQNVVAAKNIEGNTSEIFNFNYSIIKWAELASNNSTNAKERDMAKSLYAYYVAAKNFVERT